MSYVDVDKFAEAICNFQQIDEEAANKMIWLLRTFPAVDVKNNWVDFKEEKPKKNGYYFCYHMTSKCGDKEQWQMQMLYWEDSLWLYHHSTFKTADYVSHWMSLPEPPKEKNK